MLQKHSYLFTEEQFLPVPTRQIRILKSNFVKLYIPDQQVYLRKEKNITQSIFSRFSSITIRTRQYLKNNCCTKQSNMEHIPLCVRHKTFNPSLWLHKIDCPRFLFVGKSPIYSGMLQLNDLVLLNSGT